MCCYETMWRIAWPSSPEVNCNFATPKVVRCLMPYPLITPIFAVPLIADRGGLPLPPPRYTTVRNYTYLFVFGRCS